MNERQQNLLTLEEQAEKLVGNVSSLYAQIGSYNKASNLLENTNSSLIELIEQTKVMTIESHDIISKLNEIGTSEILDRMDNIDDMLCLSKKDNLINKEKLEEITVSLALNEKQVSNIQEDLNTYKDKLNLSVEKLKKLLSILLGASGIIIVLQIIALF